MKGFLLVLIALLACLAPAQVERKYDFMLVRADGSSANWGTWNTPEMQRLKSKGPALYAIKDGHTYVITDSETLRKAEAALQEFKATNAKYRDTYHIEKSEQKAGAMYKSAREQKEIGKKMEEESRIYEEGMRKGDKDADRRFNERMAELSRQMKEATKNNKAWPSPEWTRSIREFAHQMETSARITGQKISGFIDEAFAKGLAREL